MIMSEIRRGGLADFPVIALCIAYILTLLVIFHFSGLPFLRPSAYLANLGLYCASVFMMLAGVFLWSLARIRPSSPFEFLSQFARNIRLHDRLVPSIPVICAFAVFMPAFSAAKSAIPYFNAYRYDDLFARMDIWIHGRNVWELIQPLVGYPLISFVINGVYHLWILLLYMGLPLVCGWLANPAIRLQFLLSYALCWIVLGTILAIALSSVGPCFFEIFYGDARFRPLMDYLAAADRVYPLMALDVQKTLIDWKTLGSHGLGRGISAMPSMHVSIACLFVLVGWRHSRCAGLAATLFLIFILIGSIHLGYHYAVDGYMSLIVTPMLWVLSGIFARWWTSRIASPDKSHHDKPVTI